MSFNRSTLALHCYLSSGLNWNFHLLKQQLADAKVALLPAHWFEVELSWCANQLSE
jgi:hypothetical protein